MDIRWLATLGRFERDEAENRTVFRGQENESESPETGRRPGVGIGTRISDVEMTNGSVTTRVKFANTEKDAACGIIFGYEPSERVDLPHSPAYFVAMLGRVAGYPSMFAVRRYADRKWESFAQGGDVENLESGRFYDLTLHLNGSYVRLLVDGITAIASDVAQWKSNRNVGLWCRAASDIEIRDYRIDREIPTAFVVTQFSEPYDTLYKAVIGPVCKKKGFEPIRIDQKPGPGLIIADIMQELSRSSVVIADVSPVNANVFFELGYATALKKPTILIARRDTQLPFDISSYRTLFYDDSIGGKETVERDLERHLDAVKSA